MGPIGPEESGRGNRKAVGEGVSTNRGELLLCEARRDIQA
jgi:hypothetical protein